MRVGQSKWGSFAESWANVAVGFSINYAGNLFILPLFGLHITPSKAFGVGIVFTFISVARSYTLRRIFNRHTEKQA